MHTLLPALAEDHGDLEAKYRAHYLAADARQASISIAVWLIPALLFAYSDYTIFGPSTIFEALLAVRLTFCAFSLYTISALLKVTTAKDYDYIFLRWAAFATAFVLFFNYCWATHVPPSGALTVLIIFSAYMIFPNRLNIRLMPPLALSAGNFVLQWWIIEPVNSYALLTMAVSIAMANILGIIFSSLLQKHRRTEFKARAEEARIKEELSRLASIDELTGLLNRRKLTQLGYEEFTKFSSDRHPFSLLMIDIDHFKRLNDKYGHEAGDLFLARFSAYVAASLQERNIWGRLGGEEFVLILPGLPAEQAKPIAERLRLGLDGEPQSLTVSIGLTEARDGDQSFEEVLQRADKALYRAKRNGRNRTEML